MSPSMTGSIRDYCRSNNIPVFRFMISSFEALMSKYNPQDEVICINYVVSKRPKHMAKELGHFVCVLPAKAMIHDNTNFVEVIAQCQDSMCAMKTVIPYDILKYKFPRESFPAPCINFGRSYFKFNDVLTLSGVQVSFLPIARSTDTLEVTYDDGDYLPEMSQKCISLRVKYNKCLLPHIFVRI